MMKKIKAYLDANEMNTKAVALWCVGAVLLLSVCGVLLGLSGSTDGRSFPVYISEVLASNTSYPNADGRCCDYIEIHNGADYPVDLTGFQLGDIAGNARYAFPSGTAIEAGGYLVVYCDKTLDDPAYAPFAISRAGGEDFYLIASNNAIVDSVQTLATDLDQAMVRLDGENWGISSLLTPGWENGQEPLSGTDIYNPTVSPVRITELSGMNTYYAHGYGLLCDWVELYNTSSAPADISGYILSDNVGNDKYTFPSGTQVPANGYLVVCCTDAASGADIAPFGLSQYGGETVVLKNSKGMIVEIIDTLPMEDSQSLAMQTDGTWTVTKESSPGFENTSQGHAQFLRSIGGAVGDVVISELMAAEQTVLPDRFGDFSDWVELYNTTDRSIDLSGWFLSDDPRIPRKWEFPALQLLPGERTLVFCSGRSDEAGAEVHADFSLSSGGESLILSSYLGNVVDSVTFGGSETGTAFVFSENEPALTAYPTPGYPNDMEGYEAFCANLVSAGPLAIWEVMTSNDWYLPQALGVCYDWVEIRNISDESVNLSEYSISDDAEDPSMFVLPEKMLLPGECIAIILSGDTALSTGEYAHAGFSLNAAQDQLFLFHTGGELLDFVSLKQIPLGYSYGRTAETGGFYYMEPTPERDNRQGHRLISAAPVSETAPGVYVIDSAVTVNLSAAGSIYYTTDGSDPDVTCAKYNGPVQIDRTTVLRAVSVEEGKLPSEIYTATFIRESEHEIPVVSLVTDPDNLWGWKQGIYKDGDIEIKEEKRPANMAYCGEDGSFSMDCEISLHGDTTVTAFSKKSFTLRFHDNYDGALHYDVFGDGEVTTFRSLILRASHESTVSSHMHDALMAHVVSASSDSVPCQKHKYVAMYINGEYWGLYAFRELHSEEHYASHMNVPAASVTMVKNYISRDCGLYELYKFAEKNDFRAEKDYEYAKTLLDMDSFADWIIFQSYVSNIDINGNMRYYHCSVDGLWRCALVDVDLGWFDEEGFKNVATTFHHGRIVNALLKNEEFQELIATRLAQLLAGPLSDENMLATIDAMADSIRSEIPREAARWGYKASNWEATVQEMRKFCTGRAEEMIDSLCEVCHFTKAEKQHYFAELLQ